MPCGSERPRYNLQCGNIHALIYLVSESNCNRTNHRASQTYRQSSRLYCRLCPTSSSFNVILLLPLASKGSQLRIILSQNSHVSTDGIPAHRLRPFSDNLTISFDAYDTHFEYDLELVPLFNPGPNATFRRISTPNISYVLLGILLLIF